MAQVHAEITPFKAYIHERYLYDMDPSKKGLIKCQVFAVSSYPGHALTFSIILTENGSLFCYIPLEALVWKRELAADADLPPNELVVSNCLDESIAVNEFEYLKGKKVTCFFKKKTHIVKGDYLCTIDWYKQNESFNIIKLETGQICALPNYRMLFGAQLLELPPYKALKPEWRV